MPSLYLGLELLHQKEGLITKAECERIGSSKYLFFYGQCKVVAQIIPAKSISESLKICEIFELYQLLDNYDMKLTKGVSVCDLCEYSSNLFSFS